MKTQFAERVLVVSVLLLSMACEDIKKSLEQSGSENPIVSSWNYGSDEEAEVPLIGESEDHQIYIHNIKVSKYLSGDYKLEIIVNHWAGQVRTMETSNEILSGSMLPVRLDVSSDSTPRYLIYHLNTSGARPTLAVQPEFDEIDGNGDLTVFHL